MLAALRVCLARSYLSRTKDWDEYPNGRWGDVRSPAWGGFEHYLLMPKVRVARRSQEHGHAIQA